MELIKLLMSVRETCGKLRIVSRVPWQQSLCMRCSTGSERLISGSSLELRTNANLAVFFYNTMWCQIAVTVAHRGAGNPGCWHLPHGPRPSSQVPYNMLNNNSLQIFAHTCSWTPCPSDCAGKQTHARVQIMIVKHSNCHSQQASGPAQWNTKP